MMRYLILIALLLCLPVRGEAWQVVGGGVVACDDGLLSNGCFDNGETDWIKTLDSASLDMSVVDGQMVFTLSEFSYKGIKQTVILTDSASYTMIFDVIAISGGAIPGVEAKIGGTSCGTITSTGTGKSVTCNAGTVDEIQFNVPGAYPRSFTIDNVKLVAN